MGVVIGFGTTVGLNFSGVCATSVNWGYNPNAQRLYCLGTTSPFRTIQKPTQTLTISFYGDEGDGPPQHDVTPTQIAAGESCVDANQLAASVTPGICGTSVEGISASDWFLTSYSYDKSDASLPGIETWSMQRWPSGAGITAPDIVIRISAEGQATNETITGVVFDNATADVEGSTGSVSAGGVGRADVMYYNAVTAVGRSAGSTGDIDQGSASMSYQPLYY